MLELKVLVDAPALAEAINNLAQAITSTGGITSSVENTLTYTEEVTSDGQPPRPDTPVVPMTEEGKTPAQIKKDEISAKIIELGGIPPEKGSVSKFEAALAEAQEKQNVEAPTTEGDEQWVDDETGEPVAPSGDDDTVDLDAITGDDAPAVPTVDEVRTLAHALVKSTPDNPTLGKQKLGACLKKAGAPNLTQATPEQLTAIVPLIEANLGKTLAEVLAEATD